MLWGKTSYFYQKYFRSCLREILGEVTLQMREILGEEDYKSDMAR